MAANTLKGSLIWDMCVFEIFIANRAIHFFGTFEIIALLVQNTLTKMQRVQKNQQRGCLSRYQRQCHIKIFGSGSPL